MIQFDRIENDRVYLGFTQVELDAILLVLEKQPPVGEITTRLDALAMVFHRRQAEEKSR